MSDITNHYRFQRILVEASQYRTLREIFKTDPSLTPPTAALFKRVLAADRDDVAFVKQNS